MLGFSSSLASSLTEQIETQKWKFSERCQDLSAIYGIYDICQDEIFEMYDDAIERCHKLVLKINVADKEMQRRKSARPEDYMVSFKAVEDNSVKNDEENQSSTWVPFDVVSTSRVPNYVVKKKNFGAGKRQFPSEERQEAYEKIEICYDEDLGSCLLYTSPSPRD